VAVQSPSITVMMDDVTTVQYMLTTPANLLLWAAEMVAMTNHGSAQVRGPVVRPMMNLAFIQGASDSTSIKGRKFAGKFAGIDNNSWDQNLPR
jgi:hypothetical protein